MELCHFSLGCCVLQSTLCQCVTRILNKLNNLILSCDSSGNRTALSVHTHTHDDSVRMSLVWVILEFCKMDDDTKWLKPNDTQRCDVGSWTRARLALASSTLFNESAHRICVFLPPKRWPFRLWWWWCWCDEIGNAVLQRVVAGALLFTTQKFP